MQFQEKNKCYKLKITSNYELKHCDQKLTKSMEEMQGEKIPESSFCVSTRSCEPFSMLRLLVGLVRKVKKITIFFLLQCILPHGADVGRGNQNQNERDRWKNVEGWLQKRTWDWKIDGELN